jgi:hypothetical protein
MSTHYAIVLVPMWALRIRSMAELLQSTANGDERFEDRGLLHLAGQIAWNGELPTALVLGLHEQGVPYDFFIESESAPGIDQRGYWRPGMHEPRTWSEVDGEAFVWVSSVRRVLGATGTTDECLRAMVATLDEAEPVVPDLRAFPDPRATRAEDLRSVTRSARGAPVRRIRL